MTKEELQKALTDKGIKFVKSLTVAKLQILLDGQTPVAPQAIAPLQKTEEEIAAITLSLLGKGVKPLDLVLNTLTTRVDGEVQTSAGIIIPPQVMVKVQQTQWVYSSCRSGDMCTILRVASSGYKETVRVYSKDIHGQDFETLAKKFVEKNNG